MASVRNARLRRSYSRYFADGAEGIDCFSVQDWSREHNFINPDFSMIGRVLEPHVGLPRLGHFDCARVAPIALVAPVVPLR